MTDTAADPDEGLVQDYRALPPLGDHPDEETWVQLSTGALDAGARQVLADHVVSCAACANIYRAVNALHEGAVHEGLLPPVPAAAPPPGTWWSGRTALALAATTVLAVGAAVLFRATGVPPTPVVDAPTATSAPAIVEPAPPAVRDWARAPGALRVELPARYGLVMRGDTTQQAFLEAFGAAIAPYREGRYSDAAERLATLERTYPDVPEVAFYLGMSRLLGNDAAGARAPLERAERAEALGSAAVWFGAVAAEQAGDAASADRALERLCGAPGNDQARACEALGRPVP